MLRKQLAAEIGAGSTTVKVANETPGALAGCSVARGGRVSLERLGAPPEGVPVPERGRHGRCCLVQPPWLLNGHKLFYAPRDPKLYTLKSSVVLPKTGLI